MNWIDWLSGKKTYIMGLLTLILAFIVQLGFLTPDQSSDIGKGIAAVLERFIALAMDAAALLAIFLRLGSAKAETAATDAKFAAITAQGHAATAASAAVEMKYAITEPRTSSLRP